ncbi:tRNA pseudouridine(38-40) synthase TruA [Verrucomicrobium sp. BvORR106]|uniref:tRNA pseudouridine(38-40) synthase TruA n=1 Tax=Verrucomicrobium sp. BvORR106 TaxID=1403819 RepID=UPI00056F22A1|nr:tRNA pseudouridine(38-40) synthase TruA [Verrucomicrobium sp. BvORR106]
MSFRRLKLTVAYDGRPWKGWQSQVGGDTIQDRLEAALRDLTGTQVNVQGSGRTDAGVHALAQVAHADVPDALKMGRESWVRAINVRLPHSIRVMECDEVHGDFHARFDAVGKVYSYRLWRGGVMSPFEAGRAWHIYGVVDLEVLRAGAALLTGTHNFARLSANRGDISEDERREDEDGLTRTVRRIEVIPEGEVLRIEFEGDGFLYKMVRLMVGSLVHVARGRESLSWLQSLVEDPTGTKSNQCAPADGLCLMKVFYA